MLVHCDFIGWPRKSLSGGVGKIALVSADADLVSLVRA
jgi:hypothetical protein